MALVDANRVTWVTCPRPASQNISTRGSSFPIAHFWKKESCGCPSQAGHVWGLSRWWMAVCNKLSKTVWNCDSSAQEETTKWTSAIVPVVYSTLCPCYVSMFIPLVKKMLVWIWQCLKPTQWEGPQVQQLLRNESWWKVFITQQIGVLIQPFERFYYRPTHDNRYAQAVLQPGPMEGVP